MNGCASKTASAKAGYYLSVISRSVNTLIFIKNPFKLYLSDKISKIYNLFNGIKNRYLP